MKNKRLWVLCIHVAAVLSIGVASMVAQQTTAQATGAVAAATSTRIIKPTRTPRPTQTPRVKSTPKVATPAPVATKSGNAKLNPQASFDLTQKTPCGLATQADIETLLGAKLAGAPQPYTRLANGMACEYTTRNNIVVFLSAERDNKKTLLVRRLANLKVGGCGSTHNPSEEEMKPFTEKPLAEKWKLLIAAENACGASYKPVTEFGADVLAYANNGALRIVVGDYMLSAEVPGNTTQAIVLAKQVFIR